MKIFRLESTFLWLGAVLLVCCIVAIVYSSLALAIQLPEQAGRIDPQQVYSTPPFDQLGVRQTGPETYEVAIIGETWLFRPEEVRVPANARITFTGTTVDVIHSLSILGTTVNMTLIPGQITRDTYRFEQPGEYLMLCNEFCGAGHHTMYGKVIVE